MAQIRTYRPTDRADVAEVCLRTGNLGGDATGLHVSDGLLPDIYVLPYIAFEPERAFLVDTGERVAGYLVATADTRAFVERYRAEWLPSFARRYPRVEPPLTASDQFVEVGYTPERMLIPELDAYPAHLHIDLLPELQGQGFGRALIRRLLTELRGRGVPGVHLGVSPQNLAARGFYAALGFRPLPSGGTAGGLLGLTTDAIV
ncbi:MAG: GNAT family N-acetyltransferase [Microbacteriaceae bacterium]|nr:MAG: GNAT family N-acetyltransferase [Microbacteriaceae bacterium]